MYLFFVPIGSPGPIGIRELSTRSGNGSRTLRDEPGGQKRISKSQEIFSKKGKNATSLTSSLPFFSYTMC